MRTVRRLRLRFLLLRLRGTDMMLPSHYCTFLNPIGFHIPVLSTLLLIALSKPSHPQHSTLANDLLLHNQSCLLPITRIV